jgi:hypothetical protein
LLQQLHFTLNIKLGFSDFGTFCSRQTFEHVALSAGVIVKFYLADTVTFIATSFIQQIRNHNQRIQYFGANARCKNGVTERTIRSVSNMARAMLQHASSTWKNGKGTSFGTIAFKYAVYLYNHLPNAQLLCPADLFMGIIVPRQLMFEVVLLNFWIPSFRLDRRFHNGNLDPGRMSFWDSVTFILLRCF